jgi:hypothetical protein
MVGLLFFNEILQKRLFNEQPFAIDKSLLLVSDLLLCIIVDLLQRFNRAC